MGMPGPARSVRFRVGAGRAANYTGESEITSRSAPINIPPFGSHRGLRRTAFASRTRCITSRDVRGYFFLDLSNRVLKTSPADDTKRPAESYVALIRFL